MRRCLRNNNKMTRLVNSGKKATSDTHPTPILGNTRTICEEHFKQSAFRYNKRSNL